MQDTDFRIHAKMTQDEDVLVITSPAVGRFQVNVQPSALLSAGDVLGEMEILGRTRTICAPKGSDGPFRVIEAIDRGWQAVGFGETLVKVIPASVEGGEVRAIQSQTGLEDLPEGAVVVPAPIDGMFYRSASPEDPPMISEGDTLAVGQVYGLIEVMKFFYEIRFEREDLGPMKIFRIEVEDSTSVDAGAPLLILVPAT